MNYKESLAHILKHEGGWVNDPRDTGGETNLGVTKAVWEEWLGHAVKDGSMKSMTQLDVEPLYKRKYWDRVKADELPDGLNYCVFDAAINSGAGRAAKWLQESAGAIPDGAIGPNTLSAVAAHTPAELINIYCDKRQKFLESLSNFDRFGKGWTRRVAEVRKLSLDSVKR